MPGPPSGVVQLVPSGDVGVVGAGVVGLVEGLGLGCVGVVGLLAPGTPVPPPGCWEGMPGTQSPFRRTLTTAKRVNFPASTPPGVLTGRHCAQAEPRGGCTPYGPRHRPYGGRRHD